MAAFDSVYNKCSVCGQAYNKHGPEAKTFFGQLPVSFCLECFDQVVDLVKEKTAPPPEQQAQLEAQREQDELMAELRGRRRIVVNSCYGGFGLSYQASIRYLELSGIEYKLEPRQDRDSQNRLGSVIMVDGIHWHYYGVERDDPNLVTVVKELGPLADGEYAKLRIVTIPANVDWTIEEYDGREWVAERHRIWR